MMHYVALVLGIVFNAIANILVKAAMKNVEMGGGPINTAMSMAFQPLMIVGIACFIVALGGYSFALTRIELSVGYPVMTCLGLIIVAGYATLRFGEPMTFTKIGGYVLVLGGVMLVFAEPKAPAAEKVKKAAAADSKRPNARSALGMNLRFVSYSSSTPVFIDAMRAGLPWISRTSEAWDDKRTLPKSKEGWVTSLQPGQIAASLVPSALGGRMVLTWEGKGRVSVQNTKAMIEEKPNRLVFDAEPRIELEIQVQEIDAKDPPRNIVLVPIDLEKSTERFHPLFLERLAPFSVIRFLEWSHVNGSKLERWEDRTLPSQAFQSTEAGVAYEYQIELVNRLGSDLWICVPHLANDDFVRSLAKLVKEKLHPGGKVWIEWSNEVWNDAPAFTQGQFARKQGMQASLQDWDENAARLRYQSRRSVHLFKVFNEAFGDERRLIRVMASQQGNKWAHEELLEFEDAYKFTDALAIAPYFAMEIGAAKREKWILESSATAILDEIEKKSLPETIGWIEDSAKVAKKYSLDLVAYEGGQHLVADPDIHNRPGINEKLDEVNRHPRMKAMTLQLLKAWKQNGGTTFVYYAFDGAPSKWGRFGALETIDQPIEKANKYDALLDFMKANPRWW
jgi:multidrug transporter EmrE-like cation transporter